MNLAFYGRHFDVADLTDFTPCLSLNQKMQGFKLRGGKRCHNIDGHQEAGFIRPRAPEFTEDFSCKFRPQGASVFVGIPDALQDLFGLRILNDVIADTDLKGCENEFIIFIDDFCAFLRYSIG